MSFKRFDTEDVVVSADSISSTVWSTGTYELTAAHTSSTQVAGTSGDYYLDIYHEDPTANATSASAAIQYSVAYGNSSGVGSTDYNSSVSGKSPSSTIYGQYRSLVLGDEDSDFSFGGAASSKGIVVVSIDRARYKEKLLPGTLNIKLGDGSSTIQLTDNSNDVSSVTFNDAGRVYEIISGSNGTAYDGGTGYTVGSYVASYGKFLPDVGLLIFNPQAIAVDLSYNALTASGDTNGQNNINFSDLIASGSSFKLNSEETISSNYVFVRVRNSEFNYSTNPSNITGSGELRHDVMVNNPQSYITSVGLYNENNDLLAVAKLSSPLLKDFTKEALVRIKLDY